MGMIEKARSQKLNRNSSLFLYLLFFFLLIERGYKIPPSFDLQNWDEVEDRYI